ncbi:alkene reductase [Paracidobacterium acidisoli]|uniref:Alkene reductase n=1 Tax=Paracidobacterium acidisoli TaxID=2303751 RepID=A0A372IPU1_9BACT|nr:alkene reductase [Paracidobacterium acidisoli]MBT9331318.1 alkene reductase [Paracidobacterium acidisoli]
MSNYPRLFSPLRVGALALKHRVVMAPLTRMRSEQPGDVPTDLMATYYGQRASEGGLIISEATQISLQGKGYPGAPGIHSQEQVEGWKKIVQAVHAKGGFIFLQLWHVGRISHSSLHPEEGLPVAPSAIAPSVGETFDAHFGRVPFETPRALTLEEIPGLIATYRQAAENAKAAGFDGVEVHSANGYLLEEFLEDRTNRRTDIYGGSIENRARLLFEVVDTAIDVWGKDRVGVRLSPYGTFGDIADSDPVALFTYVLKGLSEKGIAYAHVIEPRTSGSGGGAPTNHDAPRTAKIFRGAFQGVFLSTGGYTAEEAEETLRDNYADAIGFGRPFIANPDLPERFRRNTTLNAPDRSTFYGGTEKGYTDYPAIEAAGV